MSWSHRKKHHLALSKCYLFRVYCVQDVVCVLSVIVAEIPQMPRHSPQFLNSKEFVQDSMTIINVLAEATRNKV